MNTSKFEATNSIYSLLRSPAIVPIIENVGVIVPLPNHYNPDMPQGHGAVRNTMFGQLFFCVHVIDIVL
jgi:hypothetical protein